MPPTEKAISHSSATRQIARAASTVMLAFVLSKLVSLASNMTIIRVFGTSADLDSFYAANRIAETLFNLMAGGALGSAFIPTFTGFLTQKDQTGAWRLASSIANLLLVVLSLISLIMAIFAPQVVRHGLYLLDPSQSPVQETLTINLLRILLPSVVIFGLSGLVMGILNAHQVFLVPAVAPAMYSFGWIIGVLVFPTEWGITRLAWGAVLGSVLHLVVQLPNLFRLRGRYTFTLGLHNASVREVARLMGPRLFGVAVVQLNFIVNTVIALGLPAGSVSAISQGFALMLMPQAAIAQSIAIAAMPTFSAQVAMGRQDEMRASLAATLRAVLLLAIPATLGLVIMRQAVVNLLYLRGACGITCTQLIAWALLWYAVGLIGHSVVEIISRAFYALHDTRTPVTVGVIAMSLNIVFSLLFSKGFSALGWVPLGGLALANSLATTLEMTALLILMHRRLNGLHGESITRAAGAAVMGSVVMAIIIWLWLRYATGHGNGLLVIGGLAIGAAVYGGTLVALRVKEVRQVGTFVFKRIKT